MSTDRLFVPLAKEPFSWFRAGSKSWEVRRLGRQYTPKHVRLGRTVELRLGYQKTENVIWGNITRVEEAASFTELFRVVPFYKIVPAAFNEEEAVQILSNFFPAKDNSIARYIAFEIAVRNPL